MTHPSIANVNHHGCLLQCIPHTFYSSIDLQLFVGGLFVVFLMAKKPFVGVSVAWLLVVAGNLLLAYSTYVNKSSPVLIDSLTTVP